MYDLGCMLVGLKSIVVSSDYRVYILVIISVIVIVLVLL
jgi:hypothetical protein